MSSQGYATPKQFETKLRQAEALVQKTAAGADNWKDVSRAFDRLYGMSRWLPDPEAGYNRIRALSRRWETAKETGTLARRSGREAEHVRLGREMRETRPRAGSYEHELALMRGGRRPT